MLAVFAFRQGQLARRLAGHPAVTSPPHVLILPSPPRVDQRHPKARFPPIFLTYIYMGAGLARTPPPLSYCTFMTAIKPLAVYGFINGSSGLGG